jgi:hypothetical protein
MIPVMAIPQLDPDGLLPPGVHDCSIDELRSRFGSFQMSDHRPRLFEKLEQYLNEARQTALVLAVLVDGSFVTSAAAPEDVDVILLLRHDHNFQAELRPFEYNVLSGRQARKRYHVDAFAAVEGSALAAEYLEFFTRVRESAGRRKGVIRVVLMAPTT